MHTFDLSGLDDLTFCDRPPVVREPDNFWFYGTGKRKKIAHCPDCDDPLLLFPQDGRLAFYCWDCRWLWLTARRETQYVRSHDTLVKEIVPKELVDDVRAAREAA